MTKIYNFQETFDIYKEHVKLLSGTAPELFGFIENDYGRTNAEKTMRDIREFLNLLKLDVSIS